ncbi:MAG TPA: trypsin-like peptidase domain-containing protein [Usitatibacter sp.]|nr:trypsin-like peptidase domain-containing protein [Usitatibacter sp.]
MTTMHVAAPLVILLALAYSGTADARAPKVVQARRADTPAPFLRLAAPLASEAAVLKRDTEERTPNIGFPRALPGLADDGLPMRLQWSELGNGSRVAHFAISSSGAAALRVGLDPRALPLQALLRFHDGAGRAIEVTGESILESIADNLEAREHGMNARTWWSPVVESSTAVVEIELPAGVQPEQVRLGVPKISHLVASAKNGFATRKEASCSLDAKCHEGAWSAEMNAEARMLFTRDGVTYACSGTLLADHDPATEIPYFHTAGHCISGQADASTVVTYWFYRSAECNGSPGRYEVVNGGAQLLFAHPETDTVLLRLNQPAPRGATYLGWSANASFAEGTPVTGVHHGGAEMQKISFGNIAGFASCMRGGEMCRRSSGAESSHYHVTWRAGTTLAGGSGSPLIADGTRELIGHLSSGMSACGATDAGDFYGRFDLAYRAGLHRWLGTKPAARITPTPVPVPPPPVVAGPRLRLTTTLSSVPRLAYR